jgi:hypothetical protein
MASHVQPSASGPITGRPEEDDMRSSVALLAPALLIAALVARCAAPTAPARPPHVTALLQLKERRIDVETYSRECFTRGWGSDPAYAAMAPREARRRADELIATHTQRLAAWETCGQEIGPKIEAYRAAVERAKRHMGSAPHVSSDEVIKVSHLLDESVASATNLVRETYPTVVELERAYVDYFRQLKAGPPREGRALAFPPDIESRERRVVQAMHEQVASAASYLEGFHRLAPSPETRARMNAAKIMAAVYRGVDYVMAEDQRSEAQRYRDFQREVQTARTIVEGEIADPAYAKFRPQTVARYRTMLGELRKVDQTLGKLVTLATGSRSAARTAQTNKLLTGLQASVDRVERLAHSIDTEP